MRAPQADARTLALVRMSIIRAWWLRRIRQRRGSSRGSSLVVHRRRVRRPGCRRRSRFGPSRRTGPGPRVPSRLVVIHDRPDNGRGQGHPTPSASPQATPEQHLKPPQLPRRGLFSTPCKRSACPLRADGLTPHREMRSPRGRVAPRGRALRTGAFDNGRCSIREFLEQYCANIALHLPS
jgi:hypothetical protein